MKKYILILGTALLTTAAVTATVLSNKTPVAKKKVECTQKMEKKECTKMMKQRCTKMQRNKGLDQVL